ncbi:MAG: monooxygenase, FAD-binding protein [Robiginitomaculum sp.]|nr:MAG: monooxygenase, FAD-binding protein [Robiginitomaculum sp.]
MARHKVLIVGGGIGGMAAAIMLGKTGHDIDLVDIDPDWRVYGAGITITGATLRAYKHLDMVDDIASHGAITNGAKIFNYDGTYLKDLDEPVLEEGLPATGGIMRPVLHELMQKRIRALDIPVHLGVTVDSLIQDEDGVDVVFSNGQKGRYDVVVGSDSINSKVRELAFDNSQDPIPTGQGCWRISMKCPPDIKRSEFYFGHKYTAGITRCGVDEMYMWLLTPDDGSLWVKDEEAMEMLSERLKDFGGTPKWIRENMTKDDWINYRPLAAVLQPGPWANGRIVLLGDSAHATTPHLASGAGMAVEGGVVLSQELNVEGVSIQDALMAYNERRYSRCRDVVESSIAIGQKQLEGGDPDEVGDLIGAAIHRLAKPF